MVEHQGIAPCIPVWKTGVYLSTPMLGNRIPCWNCTSLCGFASRRLNCSANGTGHRRCSLKSEIQVHIDARGVLEIRFLHSFDKCSDDIHYRAVWEEVSLN